MQEKMRMLVAESGQKKKSKKKVKDKKKPSTNAGSGGKANSVAGYQGKSNSINDTIGKIICNILDVKQFQIFQVSLALKCYIETIMRIVVCLLLSALIITEFLSEKVKSFTLSLCIANNVCNYVAL